MSKAVLESGQPKQVLTIKYQTQRVINNMFLGRFVDHSLENSVQTFLVRSEYFAPFKSVDSGLELHGPESGQRTKNGPPIKTIMTDSEAFIWHLKGASEYDQTINRCSELNEWTIEINFS